MSEDAPDTRPWRYPGGVNKIPPAYKEPVTPILAAPKGVGYELPVPHEDVEARQFVADADKFLHLYPELRWLHHVPNGGARTAAEAGDFKAQGVTAGIADYALDVARGGWFGWKGELKRLKGDGPTPDQRDYLEFCRQQGYRAEWHRGGAAMLKDLLDYLARSPTPFEPTQMAIGDDASGARRISNAAGMHYQTQKARQNATRMRNRP